MQSLMRPLGKPIFVSSDKKFYEEHIIRTPKGEEKAGLRRVDFDPARRRNVLPLRLGVTKSFLSRNKYKPHQGHKECARRKARMVKSDPIKGLFS